MKKHSIAIIALALAFGFTAGISCGSDGGGNVPDAARIGVNGGSLDGAMAGAGGGLDGATGGAGGSAADAPLGGAGGSAIDGNTAIDGASIDTTTGEVAQVATTICTGLTPEQCDLAIRNAAVAPTVTAQDPPVTNPPAYAVCSQ